MVSQAVIGIDLGTSFSRVAVYRKENVEVICNGEGNTSTPSYVDFTEEKILIGEVAKKKVAENRSNTRVVFDVKRLIGRKTRDPTVQQDLKYWPFHVVNDCGEPKVKIDFRGEELTFKPEEILSTLVTILKKTAEKFLGTSVFKAVITVPMYFNQRQRQAILKAGDFAGLNVLQIMNETTAATLAYVQQKQLQGRRNVLFIDLGGGNLNIAIVCIDDGTCKVKAFAGDTHLGGEDFDIRLVNYFIDEFNSEHHMDMSVDKDAVCILRTECEMAKCRLSTETQASIQMNSLYEGISFHSTITRTKFEELCSDLFESTLVQVEKALMDAGLEKIEIFEVVLVGESTRIPKIQTLLQDYFEGRELYYLKAGKGVVCGAAIQGAILTGQTKEALSNWRLVDIAPLSLDIETGGGMMTAVIKRNTSYPRKHTKTFSTSAANQTVACVKVFEGENALAIENNLLYEFELQGIPPAPRGHPQIEVTFEIDANGILEVSAVGKSTGKENRLTIKKVKSRLSRAGFLKMLNGVEMSEEHDTNQILLF